MEGSSQAENSSSRAFLAFSPSLSAFLSSSLGGERTGLPEILTTSKPAPSNSSLRLLGVKTHHLKPQLDVKRPSLSTRTASSTRPSCISLLTMANKLSTPACAQEPGLRTLKSSPTALLGSSQ